MSEGDVPGLVMGFAAQNWNKPQALFASYLVQQQKKERTLWIAEVNGVAAGYITLLHQATSGPFADRNMPEITDLNVMIKFQRNGLGNNLMDAAEEMAARRSNSVSLAVGLHWGYGSAQRMYIQRGYLPEGSGVWYKGRRLEQYAECCNDDDLLLYLLKGLDLSGNNIWGGCPGE